eukprot:187139_1
MCGGNRDQEDHEDVDFIDLEEIEAQTGNKPDPPVFDRVRSWLMPGGKLAPANVVWIVGSVLVFALVLFAAYRLLHLQSGTQTIEQERLAAKMKHEQVEKDLAERLAAEAKTAEQARLKAEAGADEKKAEEKEAEADADLQSEMQKVERERLAKIKQEQEKTDLAELQRKPMEVEDARAVKQKEKDDQAEAERQKLQKKGLAAFRRHLQEPLVKLKEKEHATEKGTAEFRRHLQEKAGLVAKEPEKAFLEAKALEDGAKAQEDERLRKERFEKEKEDRLAKEQEEERQEDLKNKKKRLDFEAHLENERIANEKNEERRRDEQEKTRVAKAMEEERVRKEHFAKLKEVIGVPEFNIEWDATKNELVLQLTKETIAALNINPAHLEVQREDENDDWGLWYIFNTEEASSGEKRIPVTKYNVKDFRNGSALRVVVVDSDGSEQIESLLEDFDGSEQIESPAKNIPQAAITYAKNH